MIKIYGRKQSRAARCLWLLEEMGLPYEQIPVNTQTGETRTAAFLALNPAGKVPVLDDAGFVVRESVAINFYLATLSATPLWPDDARTRALIHQWTSWSVTDMESPLNTMFQEKKRSTGAGVQADAGFMAAQAEAAGKALKVLDEHLATRHYLVGDAFGLADINAYTSVMLAPMFLDLSSYPSAQGWMARCAERPAWKRVQALA